MIHPGTAEVRDYWEYNGFLETTETVEVRARVKGFLTKRYFQEGAEVKGKVAMPIGVTSGAELYPGDLLYQIDKREYLTAKAKATAELAKAEADILIVQADVDRYAAQIELAKVKLQRAEESLAKKVGSQTDVDEAKANMKVATAQHKASQAQLAAAESTVGSAQSALHTTEIQLGYTDVHAPISGTIGRTVVDAGNLVGQSDPTLLTAIIRMDRLYAVFDIPERSPRIPQRVREERPAAPAARDRPDGNPRAGAGAGGRPTIGAGRSTTSRGR